ncbi:hypothetical protein [Tuwongella immobilis]|uniref:Uncharacterized protein n=1 Tax=Tuwongella immobilis TaxID=692036 RepID=A0A6C2YV54_9BACT|nr:hypothetical protein [Tuwongella immobilis]VIP04752.1 Uncharacterized protein OS=Rhodopirellula sp. SWK7 GN=RRSWK_02611 PE=4 SV=1 [Tuwongella immobilis]VTS06863.1 Uncharacterized protein OS=Rhodopirellula sp. SWK7 GN=RRSWK_02611 PE=4 SV=1 [Tuwongella immobilis]
MAESRTKPVSIAEDRPLTWSEQTLIGWLLVNGHPDAASYLPQLDHARVVSRCACGCPSIDFSIRGVVPPLQAGMDVLSDYVWQTDNGAHCGVFVFARGGLLAGLDVWSVDGLTDISALPNIERLRPIAEFQETEPGDCAADGR